MDFWMKHLSIWRCFSRTHLPNWRRETMGLRRHSRSWTRNNFRRWSIEMERLRHDAAFVWGVDEASATASHILLTIQLVTAALTKAFPLSTMRKPCISDRWVWL